MQCDAGFFVGDYGGEEKKTKKQARRPWVTSSLRRQQVGFFGCKKNHPCRAGAGFGRLMGTRILSVVVSNIFFLCSPLPGEMIQFDEHIFQMG